MNTRLVATLTLTLALAAGLPGSVAAQGAPQKPEGSILIGATAGSNTDNLNRLAEYDVAKDGALPRVAASLWGDTGNLKYDLVASHGGDSRDQKYGAVFSTANGRVKASFGYDRFQHRLDHDPLDYVGGSIATFVVRATDHDAGRAYAQTTGNWHADVEVAANDHLRLFASHRMIKNDGVHQSMTTSHCANCHIDSYGRRMDQVTQTLAAGAKVSAGRFTLDYTFESRTFEERSATPTHVYDNAVHPLTLADVFVNRVQYDDGNGPLPFDLLPKFTKQTNTVRAAYALPGDGALSGTFTHSRSENDHAEMGADFTGVNGRFVMPLGKRAYVKAFFRRYEIETESVFVDIVEPIAPAGPMAGLTYAQGYPDMLPLDYYTHATASRTPTEMALELAFRPGKRSSINLGYEYEAIDRTDFMVDRTTTSTFKGSAYYRPDKTVSLRARAELALTSSPFANLHAAKPGILQLEPTPGLVPFGPLSTQYFTMYDSRSANLSSVPTDSFKVDTGFSWAPSQKFTVSGHYRYRDMKNDELNASTWSHAVHMPGVEVYIAPNDRFTLAAGWGYQKDTLDTVFSTLNFVG